jgi:hypothetical protein
VTRRIERDAVQARLWLFGRSLKRRGELTRLLDGAIERPQCATAVHRPLLNDPEGVPAGNYGADQSLKPGRADRLCIQTG